jgi:hypothetical protein
LQAETLKKCSQCKLVSYCDNICQKKDWVRHKGFCKKTQFNAEAENARKEIGVKKGVEKEYCCSNCETPNATRKCSRCKKVFYCSTECQKQHWKQPAGHKEYCLAVEDGKNCDFIHGYALLPSKCIVCQECLPVLGFVSLPCSHEIHLHCVLKLRDAFYNACPICRLQFPASFDKDIKEIILRIESTHREPIEETLTRTAGYHQTCVKAYANITTLHKDLYLQQVLSLNGALFHGFGLRLHDPLHLGCLHFLNGKIELAIESFKEAVLLDPNNLLINMFLAQSTIFQFKEIDPDGKYFLIFTLFFFNEYYFL